MHLLMRYAPIVVFVIIAYLLWTRVLAKHAH